LAGGHAIWILMLILSSGLSVAARYLPEQKPKPRNDQAR
jgi:hypothetical protein